LLGFLFDAGTCVKGLPKKLRITNLEL